jgi:phosphoribosylformylglycinamidine synthase PurS subunit
MTRFEVIVRPRPGVADPPAAAISTALRDSGYGECSALAVGRYLVLRVAEADVERAADRAHALCRDLLVSPHLETYELRPLPDIGDSGAEARR